MSNQPRPFRATPPFPGDLHALPLYRIEVGAVAQENPIKAVVVVVHRVEVPRGWKLVGGVLTSLAWGWVAYSCLTELARRVVP